ncbi:MAG: hypothetical protein IJZ32_03820 [Clostridia bacterium]|nr:hypothetical protein [Clostridia bacterium]
MTKVIVLQGNDDTGKTQTLKKVIELLLQYKARLINFSNNFAKWLHGDQVADIWAIMEYNGQIIYITTAGDFPKIIRETFNNALQISKKTITDIDVYVGAIHTTPLAKETIHEIAQKMRNANIQIIDKAIACNPADLEICNQSDASQIFNLIH